MVALDDSDPRLSTIRALLAKAEATTFAAEAEAFTAKASELMARYAIDEAMVWATSSSDTSSPVELRLEVFRPFVAQKAVLVHRVSEVFGCRAIRLGRGSSDQGELISIVGFATDLELVETLITSLFLQLTSAMTASPDQPRGRSASEVAGWRRSFIMGFTSAIADRLQRDRVAAAHETPSTADSSTGARHGRSAAAAQAGPSVELVLADRAATVDEDFRYRFPHIRSSSVSHGTSAAGRKAGTSAGQRADLGGRRFGGRGALGRAG